MTTGSSFETIGKPPVDEFEVAPNIDRENVSGFDWQTMFAELDWLPGGGLNKAHEAIDPARQRDQARQAGDDMGGQERRTRGLHLRRPQAPDRQVRKCAQESGDRDGR